jgi:hypothetical protein
VLSLKFVICSCRAQGEYGIYPLKEETTNIYCMFIISETMIRFFAIVWYHTIFCEDDAALEHKICHCASMSMKLVNTLVLKSVC